MSDTISTTRRGGVVEVRFDRGEHNAVDARMVAELNEVLGEIAGDDSAQVVVLTGAGRSFCPGADLSTAPDASDVADDLRAADYGATVLLHEMPQLTVAAVNGACAGAGMAWAAACDLRIASSRARFNMAFLQVGVAGDMGGAWTLPRLLGGARARDLFYLAGKFDAHEAERIGFVSRVLAEEDFMGAVYSLLEPVIRSEPEALRMMKANFLAAERMDLADYVELETERHLGLFRGAKGRRTRELLSEQGRSVHRG